MWSPLDSKSTRGGCTAGAPAVDARRTARNGRFRVVLQDGSAAADRPDRLAVFDARTGAALHAWPLPARADTVDLARGVAVLSTSNGVYAVRLRDGQNALVGVKRRGDYPQIESPGVVFQDDLYKRAGGPSLLKFVPFATVSNALRPSGPLRVPTTIGDFAMDGRSVIFVKHDPTGQCDHIGLWSIPWHYSTDLMDEPPICPKEHAPAGSPRSPSAGSTSRSSRRTGRSDAHLEHDRPVHREGRDAEPPRIRRRARSRRGRPDDDLRHECPDRVPVGPARHGQGRKSCGSGPSSPQTIDRSPCSAQTIESTFAATIACFEPFLRPVSARSPFVPTSS